jgi:hypothetical protein
MRTFHRDVAWCFVLCGVLTHPVLAQDPVGEIRRLYEGAAFQQVLDRLDTFAVDDREAASIALQYRALSLVALRRSDEARGAIEAMIAANPMNPITIPHVPPRFRAMTLGLWRPFMRDLIERNYRDGKAAYRAGAWTDAAAVFEVVLSAVHHPELGFEHDPRMNDVGDLAAEYRELVRARASEAQPSGPADGHP